jgi:hypothetical protein
MLQVVDHMGRGMLQVVDYMGRGMLQVVDFMGNACVAGPGQLVHGSCHGGDTGVQVCARSRL